MLEVVNVSSRRNVRANETIKLQARFKDDLGNISTATGVVLHIYEPGADTSDSANALVQNAVPTYIGSGIYEYEYTVPNAGPAGVWIDQWEGTLATQTVTATSVRKLRLEAGTLFKNIDDYTLESAILEASLEVDSLTFNTNTAINSKVFEHARRQYATCLAASTILNGSNSILLRSKTLDDLSVQYDNSGILEMSNKLRECLDKWQMQVMTKGGAKSVTQPKGVVKGEYDPDRPVVSRMWQSTEDGSLSRRIPVANDRQIPIGKRRAIRNYRNKKNWW